MTTDMQTAGAGLLAAILADPADDVPRLIYADWLEEQGDYDRAEFIRAQCELARMPHRGRCRTNQTGCERRGGCQPCRLRRRERELLALPRRDRPHPDAEEFCYTNLRLWCEAAALVVPDGARIDEHVTFRRGFVAALTCTVADWLAHADAITAAQPVEEVMLTTLPEIYRDDLDRRWRRTEVVLMGLRLHWPRITFHLPNS